MKIAIVTGASSGLGMAFVRRLDALGGLDEIWGVARRGERLEALAAELRTPMRPLALDLTRLESVETLRVLMREEAPEVAVLVNAAGFGKFGTCAELTLQETLRHDRPELPGIDRDDLYLSALDAQRDQDHQPGKRSSFLPAGKIRSLCSDKVVCTELFKKPCS